MHANVDFASGRALYLDWLRGFQDLNRIDKERDDALRMPDVEGWNYRQRIDLQLSDGANPAWEVLVIVMLTAKIGEVDVIGHVGSLLR